MIWNWNRQEESQKIYKYVEINTLLNNRCAKKKNQKEILQISKQMKMKAQRSKNNGMWGVSFDLQPAAILHPLCVPLFSAVLLNPLNPTIVPLVVLFLLQQDE